MGSTLFIFIKVLFLVKKKKKKKTIYQVPLVCPSTEKCLSRREAYVQGIANQIEVHMFCDCKRKENV